MTREQLIAHLELHDWIPAVEPAYYSLTHSGCVHVYLHKDGDLIVKHQALHEDRTEYFRWLRESFSMDLGGWADIPDVEFRAMANYILEGRHDP